jgi:hypothetical protein
MWGGTFYLIFPLSLVALWYDIVSLCYQSCSPTSSINLACAGAIVDGLRITLSLPLAMLLPAVVSLSPQQCCALNLPAPIIDCPPCLALASTLSYLPHLTCADVIVLPPSPVRCCRSISFDSPTTSDRISLALPTPSMYLPCLTL